MIYLGVYHLSFLDYQKNLKTISRTCIGLELQRPGQPEKA